MAPKNESEYCPLHKTFSKDIEKMQEQVRELELRQERDGMKLGIIATVITAVILTVGREIVTLIAAAASGG